MTLSNPTVVAELGHVVRFARTGAYASAASSLNQALMGIQDSLAGVKDLPSAAVTKLQYSLETLMMMQEQNDWVAVADVLEYELGPLWRETFGTRE